MRGAIAHLGYVYDSTVHHAAPSAWRPATRLTRIEPKIQSRFARTPPVTADEAAILDCIDWIAQGFEIVQCSLADRKFNAVDAIAAFAVYSALVVGTPVPLADIEDCAARLRSFKITLFKNE